MACVTSVVVSPSYTQMKIGDKKQLSVTVCPLNATNRSVTWSSNKKSVATVDSCGNVTAHATGSATIKAMSNDGSGYYSTCNITVASADILVTSVSISPSTTQMNIGDSKQLSVTVCPSDATNRSVKWSSNDTSVATVDSYGNVTAHSAGSATIRATANDCSGHSSTCNVTVKNSIIPTTSVTVSPSNIQLGVNDSATLRATSCPTYATNKCLTWTSSNTHVATVNPSSGYVYAQNAGTAVITATAQDGSCCRDTCCVTVLKNIPVNSVTLNHSCLTLNTNSSHALTATVCPTNANNKNLSWSSNNTSVATVDSCGNVTTHAVGSATIKATAQDGSCYYDSCLLTIVDNNNILATSITVTPSCIQLHEGDSTVLSATVCPTNATNKCVTWSSSNSNVATVNPNSGLVYAHCPGTATITATALDGSGKRDSCKIEVEENILVTSVILHASCVANQIVGWSGKIKAFVEPSNATNPKVLWSSSDESVATVNQEGLITSLSNGTTVITAMATDGSGHSDSYTITLKYGATLVSDANGASCKVVFGEGEVWKYIGVDLMHQIEYNIDVQQIEYDNYNHNKEINYSIQQLAFLFNIDPYGVAFYVNQRCLHYQFSEPAGFLNYMDDIYREIYGIDPRYFTYEDGQLYYWEGIDDTTRSLVYSAAELIFGMHKIFDLETILELAFNVLVTIVSTLIPAVGVAFTTYDLAMAVFFSGSFEGLAGDGMEQFISDLIEDVNGKKGVKGLDWAFAIFGIISDAGEILLETPPDMSSYLAIFKRVPQLSRYTLSIEFANGDSSTMSEFLANNNIEIS